MNLIELLAPYKYFSLANHEDNQEILEFFKIMKMETKSLSLRYDRGTNFFKFAFNQSMNPYIFLMRNENQKILGIAALLIIPHIINGKEVKTGYLGDLRISPFLSSKIRLTWKKCYRDLIVNFNKIEEFKDVDYLYSAILDENQLAMKSLLKNNDDLIYKELTTYETQNLYLKNPFSFAKFNQLKNEYTLSEMTFNDVSLFLKNNLDDKGMYQSVTEIIRRTATWENFSAKSFNCIKNNKGKVLAIFAPWIPSSKKLVVEKVDSKNSFLGFLLPLIGIPSIKTKKEITVLYITHLTFNNAISKTERNNLLLFLSAHYLSIPKRKFHLVSFFTYPNWEFKNNHFLGQKIKGRFYQVMSKENFEQNHFLPLNNQPPAFEIGIA